MKKYRVVLILTILMMILVGCGQKEGKAEEKVEDNKDKLNVVVTIYPICDFTQKIAGDTVNITQLIPMGSEPHDFEPSAETIKSIENADMLIVGGAGIDSWMEKVLGSISNKDLVLVDASYGMDLLDEQGNVIPANEYNHPFDFRSEADGENSVVADAHYWLDPLHSKVAVSNILEGLSKINPDAKDEYAANAKEISDKLDGVDKEYREALTPFEGRTMIVPHMAFGYLCHNYGIKQVGIKGFNAESEPSAKTMAEIVDTMKELNITTIFTEEVADKKVSETLANEVGAKTEVLSPIETLTEDDINNNEDYFTIMERNLKNIVGAFQN